MQRLLVIENPRSSRASPGASRRTLRLLANGYSLEWERTAGPGDGTRLAYEAASDGFDAVAALGGDGTINEVANGLRAGAGGSPPPAFALLPAGQADVLARIVGLPREAERAAELLLRPGIRPRPLDLGSANGRCFTFAAGIGLDAAVARRVDRNPGLKRRFGPWYYAAVAVAVAEHYRRRPPRLLARADGNQLEGVSVVVQAAPIYTYFGRLAVALGRGGGGGALAATALRSVGAGTAAAVFWRAVLARRPLAGHRAFAELPPAAELTVTVVAGGPLALQLDGDHVGEIEQVTFQALPGALSLLA